LDPTPRARRTFSWLVEATATLLLATALVYAGVERRTGDTGLARVADDQVAVVVDRSDGSTRTVQQPGYVLFVPLLQKVHRLDRSPHVLRMEGNRPDGRDRVPQLIARAKDGSSFWLKDAEVQYALVPETASAVIEDVGPELAADSALLAAAARSILRDELGRFTSEEVARGECLQDVKRDAAVGLNAVLRPHGLEVLGISIGKPVFDDAYEDAIKRRTTFAQEVDELKGRLSRLEKEQEQKEAAIRKNKEVERRKLEGSLAQGLANARREDVRVRQEADDAARALLEGARTARHEKELQAENLKAKYVAAARGVYREGLDLEGSGELPVRAALVRKLAGIQFDLVPYSRDPAPQRVEYDVPPPIRGKP
jgi:hypothetical protein